jgi:hypothetical protein
MWLATIRWLSLLLVAVAAGTAVAADPPARLSEDGAVILYRAQPGDLPAAIADRFGIAPAEVPSFLAANGVSDPSKLAAGHLFRIPNPLAARATAAEARAEKLAADADAARGEARDLQAQVATLTARADELAQRSARLATLARLWPWLQLIGGFLIAGLGVAAWVAYQSASRTHVADRYARELTEQVDERRRSALAERQASARKILDLEEAVRTLERELTPLRAVHRRPTGTH